MAKLSITLKIAGSSYPFPDIEASDEEMYRRAEREVNRLFAQNTHPSLLPKDQLALAALELAMENIKMSSGRRLNDDDNDRLAKIERKLDAGLLNKTEGTE